MVFDGKNCLVNDDGSYITPKERLPNSINFLPPLTNMVKSGFDFYVPNHHGQDYAGSNGADAQASGNGWIAISDACKTKLCTDGAYGFNGPAMNGGYGNVIVIEYPFDTLPREVIAEFELDPGESLFLLYAHLASPLKTRVGDKVKPGQIIGQVGTSGSSDGVHLHFEVRKGESMSVWGPMCQEICDSTQELGTNFSDWRSMDKYNPDLVPWTKIIDEPWSY